jgi:hypothetical protein
MLDARTLRGPARAVGQFGKTISVLALQHLLSWFFLIWRVKLCINFVQTSVLFLNV